MRLTQENVSVGLDGKYDSTKTDSAVVELNDLLCRRLSFPPKKFVADGSVQQDITIFRRTDCPPDDFAAGRIGDYIRRNLWTVPSVCNEPVTGSHAFGSSRRLGRCCLWWAALPSHGIGSAEVPLILLLLLAVGSDELHEVTLLNQPAGMKSRSGENMTRSYSWIIHCVSTLYGQMAEVNSLNYTCIKIISASVCYFSFLLLIQQFIGSRRSPFFRLILTFSCCIHVFLREQELKTDRMPLTDMTFLMIVFLCRTVKMSGNYGLSGLA